MGTNEDNYNVTILVAEDEESNFLLLKTILKRHCNVLQARTGLELLRIFEEKGADMILLDIKMPEMNGIDALKEIRKKNSQEFESILNKKQKAELEKMKSEGRARFEQNHPPRPPFAGLGTPGFLMSKPLFPQQPPMDFFNK